MALALIEIVKDQNGYESESQVIAYGIPRRKLIKAVYKGEIIWFGRGLYALPET